MGLWFVTDALGISNGIKVVVLVLVEWGTGGCNDGGQTSGENHEDYIFVFVFVVVAMMVVTRHLDKTINTGGKLVR